MSRTSLRLRVVPRLPATLNGGNGIKVVKNGLAYTVQPDTPSLITVPSIASLTKTFFQAYNSDTDSYSRISAQNLVENIQDVIIGPNLSGLDAIATSANQVPYFLDNIGNASSYTISNFVRSVSNAVDAPAFRTSLGLGTAALNNASDFGTAEQGAKADTALQPLNGLSSYASIASAQAANLPTSVKRLFVQFRDPFYADIATLNGGGEYRSTNSAGVSGYPSTSYFQSADGGYWLLDEKEPDPLQFGAKGDYTTDDYAAINAAMQYAVKTNSGSAGQLKFTSIFGYAFGTSIAIPNGQKWRAVGQIALKWLGAGAVAITLVGSNASAEGFTLQNGGGNITASVGFRLGNGEQGQGQVIRGCVANDFAYGIESYSGVLWRMENNIVNRSHVNGYRIRNVVNADSGDGTITGCTASNAGQVYGDAAFKYESGGGLKFTNNKALSFSYGFDMQIPDGASTVDLMFLGNSIENQTVASVRLGRSGTTGSFGSITITGNELANAPVGIDIYAGANNGSIAANSFNIFSTSAVRIGVGAPNFVIGLNNYSACTANIVDNRDAATSEALSAELSGGVHVSSATTYTYYTRVDIPSFRTVEIDLLLEGIVQGVGFSARSYKFFATNTGSAIALTTINNGAIGATIDLDVDVTGNTYIRIGYRRNSAGGGTTVDATANVKVRGRIGALTRLA